MKKERKEGKEEMGIERTKGREAREKEARNRMQKEGWEKEWERERGEEEQREKGGRKGTGKRRDEREREGVKWEEESGEGKMREKVGKGERKEKEEVRRQQRMERRRIVIKHQKTQFHRLRLTLRNTIRKSPSPLIARTGFFKLFSTHWTGWREEPQSPILKQAPCRDRSAPAMIPHVPLPQKQAYGWYSSSKLC